MVIIAQQFLFTACNKATVATIQVTDLVITSASLPVAIPCRFQEAPSLRADKDGTEETRVETSQFTFEVWVDGVNAVAKSFMFHPITDVFPSEPKLRSRKKSERTAG